MASESNQAGQGTPTSTWEKAEQKFSQYVTLSFLSGFCLDSLFEVIYAGTTIAICLAMSVAIYLVQHGYGSLPGISE